MTRELLVDRLLHLSAITDLYGARDAGFATGAIGWLEETERALGQIRHPAAGLAAAERGRIFAAADGLRDPDVNPDGASPRRMERAVAAVALARVEAALRSAAGSTEAVLAQLDEQMAQLVAYSSVQSPIPAQGTTPREEWLKTVWGRLAENGEKTRQLHAYLAARLDWVDRLYVLGNVLDNALANGGTEAVAASFSNQDDGKPAAMKSDHRSRGR